MIAYDDDSDGIYQILDLKNRKVFRSRDVTFNEPATFEPLTDFSAESNETYEFNIESHIVLTSQEDLDIDCSPDDIRSVLSANAQPDIHTPSEDENILCALGIDCASDIFHINDRLPFNDLPNTTGYERNKEKTLYSTNEQHITQTESKDDQQREPL